MLPIWNTYTGTLGTVQEGDPFNYALSFTNPELGSIQVDLISGELPPGLTIDNTGLISGIVNSVEVEQTYYFTIRLTNISGSIDRNFNITVSDIIPVWSDPTNLGSISHYSLYEFQFFVTDPGGSAQRFVKIDGELPRGLELTESGKLYGLIELVESSTLYTFTIRAYLDDSKFEDKTFTLTVNTAGNRAPLWNDPAGLLGEITFGVFFEFQFSAGDPDLNSITFTALGLPPGFTITPSGYLSGTLTDPTPSLYAFSVKISDGAINVSRTFTLNANNQVISPIVWVTPSGSLGDIKEGDKSLFSVKAESDSIWLRYVLDSGSLPLGLEIDINTGDIIGQVQEQVATDTEFNFTIKAYNTTQEEFRDFSINVLDAYDASATRVYAALYGNDRLLWQDLFTTDEISINNIFRQVDSQFGLVESPKILLVENLDAPTPDDIFTVFEDFRRTYLTLGKVEVAKAVYNNEFVYEVLYRKIYDDNQDNPIQFTHPQNSNTITTGGLQNMRDQLLANISSSGGEDRLPLFMTSEQIIGDSSTILGWFPAIVFAHVKPGTGQAIADKINANDVQMNKLYSRRVRIDRVIMEPAADSTFDPQFILFDNLY